MTLKDGNPCKKCGESDWYACGRCKKCTRDWKRNNKERVKEINAKSLKKYKDSHGGNGYLYSYSYRDSKEGRREYYLKNKEKRRESARRSYQKNKQKYMDRKKRYLRKWRKRNKEKVSEYNKRYEKTHKETVIANEHKKRARKRESEGCFSAEEWKQLCDLYDNRCLCCGKRKKLTVDHVIPLSKGGSNYISNIQPLCKECNNKKYTKSTDYRKQKV